MSRSIARSSSERAFNRELDGSEHAPLDLVQAKAREIVWIIHDSLMLRQHSLPGRGIPVLVQGCAQAGKR